MTINQADIKLLESERMTDTPDGGGRRTSRAIADGVAGNVYPKVSRLDSVYGRVNFRKVFGLVATANTDTLGGAHVVVLDSPDDPKIRIALFSTANDFDTRTQARDRVESYVIAGPDSRMALYGRQLIGQQAITVIQRAEDPLPDVGEVYCLSTEVAGVTSAQQYFRIEDVAQELRTFTDSAGDFTRRVITLKTATPLRYEFAGVDVASRNTQARPATLVRSTTAADASRYFGIANIAEDAAAGDLGVRVDSVFTNIVPTNQRETAINSTSLAGARIYVQSGADVPASALTPPIGAGSSQTAIQTTTLQLGTGLLPRSLKIRQEIDNSTRDTAGYVTDDGNGILAGNPTGLAQWNGARIVGGTVDYDTGVVVVNWITGGFIHYLMGSYTPTAGASQSAHILELPMTLATRGTVHTAILDPLPAKGTVVVDYRALGKWYRLRDDGTGKIGGDDAAYGTGTIDPVTGNLVVTLGALPDVGSSVIVTWGSPTHFERLSGASAQIDNAVQQTFALTQLPVKPGTLTIKYTAAAVEYTATADAAGVITGGGVTGTVNHVTGEVALRFATRAPNVGSGLTVSYSKEDPTVPSAPTSTKGTGTIAPGAPSFDTVAGVASKGLRVAVPVLFPAQVGQPPTMIYLPAQDDGLGHLVTLATTGMAGSIGYSHAGGVTVGTVVNATGVVTIDTGAGITIKRQEWRNSLNGGGSWSLATTNMQPATGDYGWTARTTSASAPVVVNAVVTQEQAPLQLDLLTATTSSLVPRSVRFTAFGVTYFDNGFGGLINVATGAVAGSINYATGVASLSSYTGNVALGASVATMLAKRGDFSVTKTAFRTGGSPLRPGSTFIQVTAADGATLTSVCDVNGQISGGSARGTVNQQFGIVHIEWGAMVPAAGNEAQPWYDPANVVGSQVWKPREVMPDTIRYSTVVLTSLPVNADVIGLDPVRLPTDGRVPIFRPSDVVLVHHTADYVLPNPPGAGVTYAVGRTDLADLVLLDATGARVAATQYAVNLEAGSVTMAADMNLLGYTLPLKARHRIEELTMATDVQINGEISLSTPLARPFPAGSRISSALLAGDLFAHVTNVFDQATWTNKWQDSRIGDDTAANYDVVNFPIEVLNDGAATERWRIHFTSTTAFQVIGENVGIIASGTIGADCSPANPLTGKPYFKIKAAGWGIGWAAGNQLRFNTVGATVAIWSARTVLPGASLTGDELTLQLRGDVDA